MNKITLQNALPQVFSGKDYIDLGSGIGTNSLGVADDEWAAAVSKQAATLAHCSNLYYNPVTAELAEKLCKVSGMKKVFFSNSGAAARSKEARIDFAFAP